MCEVEEIIKVVSEVIGAHTLGELHSLRMRVETPVSVASFVFIEVVVFTISSPKKWIYLLFILCDR